MPATPRIAAALLAGGTALGLTLGCPAATAGPAAATASARFLEPNQFDPIPGSSPWTSGNVNPGKRDSAFYCVTTPLPVDRTQFRNFDGERASAYQHVVAQPTAKGAKLLVSRYVKNLKCLVEQYKGQADVRIRTLGSYGKVGDGMQVIGVLRRYKKGSFFKPGTTGLQMFAVGRDGRYVTTVELDLYDVGLKQAPVKQFAAVGRTAVGQLQ